MTDKPIIILERGILSVDKKYEKVVSMIMSNFTGRPKNIDNISITMSMLTLINLLGIINFIYTDVQKLKFNEQKTNEIKEEPEQNEKVDELKADKKENMNDTNQEIPSSKLVNIEELRKIDEDKRVSKKIYSEPSPSPLVWRFPTK